MVENQPIGVAVGELSVTNLTDGDSSSYTYSLVSGDGDDGNSYFGIDGTQLKTARTFDYETQSYHLVRIRASDGGKFRWKKVFSYWWIIPTSNPRISC